MRPPLALCPPFPPKWAQAVFRMTTLDPSHLPWLAGNADPGTGAAVHTSVRGVPAASPKPRTSARRQQHGQENAADLDEHDAIRQWQREHRKQRRCVSPIPPARSQGWSSPGLMLRLACSVCRRERDEARQANRIPTLPLPDVRFEQSYLLSIQRQSFRLESERAGCRTDVDEPVGATVHPRQPSSTRERPRQAHRALRAVQQPRQT